MDTARTTMSIEELRARARERSTIASATSSLHVEHSTENTQPVYETPEQRRKETGSFIPTGYDDFCPVHQSKSRDVLLGPALKPRNDATFLCQTKENVLPASYDAYFSNSGLPPPPEIPSPNRHFTIFLRLRAASLMHILPTPNPIFQVACPPLKQALASTPELSSPTFDFYLSPGPDNESQAWIGHLPTPEPSTPKLLPGSPEQKMRMILDIICDARISPVDVLKATLDPKNTGFSHYQAMFYKKGGKMASLLDRLAVHPHEQERIEEWLTPHAVDIVCKTDCSRRH